MAAIFLAAERNEWDSLTLLEHRTDRERTRRVFEEANARYKASIQSRHQPFRKSAFLSLDIEDIQHRAFRCRRGVTFGNRLCQ